MKSFGITHQGLVRHLNEDAFRVMDQKIGKLNNLYVIADGMGGHNAGDVASKQSIHHLTAYLASNSEEMEVNDLLEKAIQIANLKVYEEGSANELLVGMGTTLVICTLQDGMLHVANVGDSRLYIAKSQDPKDQLTQVTMDHSVVEELYRAGHITEVQKHHHPDGHMITRAIGVDRLVEVDTFKVSMEGIDFVLLCSDGLSKMLSDREIAKIIRQHETLEEAGNALVEAALSRGGKDNITLIIIEGNEV